MPRKAADIHRDIMEVKLQIYIIAFAFNAKTFAIAILVLFFFIFPSLPFFERIAKSFSANFL